MRELAEIYLEMSGRSAIVEISNVFFVQLNFDILISIHVEVYCGESLKLSCCSSR